MNTKKVYLIGAGPGRPDLITVRGLNILREADVIIYDYLIDSRILEQAKEGAELICGDKKKIANLLIEKVKQGKKVIRLKNGDPSIFARSTQELDALLKKKIEFELVPGVTAANAAACLSGIPLTDRRVASSCVFVTGHEDPSKNKSSIDWASLAKSGTVVLYMAVENLDNIVKRLYEAGQVKDTPVAIIQNVSLPTQKVITGTLRDIMAKAKREKLKSPAVVIVGEVAKLEKKFNWLKKNKRILFTGLSAERFFNQATFFHLPLIKIEPMKDYRGFDDCLRNIKKFDWIVFASRYAVEYFFKRLRHISQDARVLNNIKIAVIGHSSAHRLLDFAILADLIPKQESSVGLIKEFQKLKLQGKKIFLPRSDISDKGLSLALEKLGAQVTTSFAYRNVMPKNLPNLDLNFFNEIVFSSPSTVRNFKQRYKAIPGNVKIRCIGEVTRQQAKRCRLLD